jgi:phage terminase large subunit-like protein
MQRIVVAVDPSGTKGDGKGDDIGIVVAGKGSTAGPTSSPTGPVSYRRTAGAAERSRPTTSSRPTASSANQLRRRHGRFVIQTADKQVPYKEEVASRGKARPGRARLRPLRARPRLARRLFPDLEDQMAT